MGRIPEETIEQILAATDIVDLIGSYFPLQRAGSSFRVNCPFHGEKTPSFYVNPGWQNYKCFGCGESGNALSFLMEYENLPFIDAVKKLADRASITITEEAHDPESDRKRRKLSRIKELNNKTARFYHEQLLKNPDAEHARSYLKSRGFSKETTEKWLIGWAPRNSNLFLQMARDGTFTGREIVQAGLGGLKDKENSRAGLWVKFYDQLTFPIHNDVGDVVGFSCRVLREDDKRGKYINTSDTPLFNKSKLLFALDKARRPMGMGKDKFALICEGQVDAIVLHESGFENAIAGLGTALTEDHARMIKRYTDRVVLCYDGDKAGLAAADKTFKRLTAEGLPVKMMHLPEGDDPDTFIKAHGAEAFRELMAKSKDYFDAKLDKELPNINLSSASERAKLLGELAESVVVMSDDLLRDATIQNLAIRLRLGVEDFRQVVSAEKNKPKPRERRDDIPQKEVIEPSPIDHLLSYLCHLAFNSEAAAEYLNEQLESLDECLEGTLGSSILYGILSKRPNPESAAAKQAYLMTISTPDRLALEKTFTDKLPVDPVSSASDTVAMLSARFYQMKEKSLRSRQNDPNLTGQEIIETIEEAKRIQSILKDLDQRF